MKLGKTKSIRTGDFCKWRYAGSIGGIEFFACPKSKGAEEILLPGNIITIEGFGNIRFSLPAEAILTMEIFRKQEIQRSGFKPQDTLPEGIMHSYSISRNTLPAKAETSAPKPESHKEEQERKKLTEHALALKDSLFKEIAERIAPLPLDATSVQRVAKLQELFDLLKKDGGLGIAYEPSEERKPKTPNEVLAPGKDRMRKADCDEFSLLFVAAAKRLNVNVSDVGIGVMKFEAENEKGDKKEALHAAALMVGNDKYLIDPVFDIFKKVPSFEIKDVQPLYNERQIDERFKIVGILSLEIAGTPEQMAAIHYREMAKYREDKAKGKSGVANGMELALMGAKVKKGLLLDPESLLLSKMRYSLVHIYLDIADEYGKSGNRKESAEYANKALSLYGPESEILEALKDRRLSKDDKEELFHSADILGRAYFADGNYEKAAMFFDISIHTKPEYALGYQNKIGSLLYVMNTPTTNQRIRTKKEECYADAKTTKEEFLSKHLPIPKELQDLFDQIDELAPSFEKPTE